MYKKTKKYHTELVDLLIIVKKSLSISEQSVMFNGTEMINLIKVNTI